jgi:hypothetical protein
VCLLVCVQEKLKARKAAAELEATKDLFQPHLPDKPNVHSK